MGNTSEGGRKAAETSKKRYGQDVLRKRGKKGGNPWLKKGFKYGGLQNPL